MTARGHEPKEAQGLRLRPLRPRRIMPMHPHRIFLGTMLALAVVALAIPASALEVHGSGFRFEASPVIVGAGLHDGGHRHHHERQGHSRHAWRPHRRGPGKGFLTLHTMEHRHGGLGRHAHREWRRQRHREAPRHHGPRRSDDWEDGAGIALGLLAGMLLLNQFADGASAAGTSGHTGAQFRILDAHSRQRQSRAIRDVLETGGNSVATWENPANRSGGASGEVRITRNGRDDYGNPCREYHQTVRVGNRAEQGYAVACRDPQGNWHLQP